MDTKQDTVKKIFTEIIDRYRSLIDLKTIKRVLYVLTRGIIPENFKDLPFLQEINAKRWELLKQGYSPKEVYYTLETLAQHL